MKISILLRFFHAIGSYYMGTMLKFCYHCKHVLSLFSCYLSIESRDFKTVFLFLLEIPQRIVSVFPIHQTAKDHPFRLTCPRPVTQNSPPIG